MPWFINFLKKINYNLTANKRRVIVVCTQLHFALFIKYQLLLETKFEQIDY